MDSISASYSNTALPQWPPEAFRADGAPAPQAPTPAPAIDPDLHVYPLTSFISFDAVVSAAHYFNRARITYALDPEDEAKREGWNQARQVMQAVLNQYERLSSPSRHLLNLILEVWAITDICFEAAR